MTKSTDYLISYDFSTKEGYFESPDEYEQRIMANGPDIHPFLSKIGVKQTLFDHLSSQFKNIQSRTNNLVQEYGETWWNTPLNGTSIFTSNAEDVLLTTTLNQVYKDRNRVLGLTGDESHSTRRNNIFKIAQTIFFLLVEDEQFLENFKNTEFGGHKKKTTIYQQGMLILISHILRFTDEFDKQDDPINSFVVSYILFKQYGYCLSTILPSYDKRLDSKYIAIFYKLFQDYSKDNDSTVVYDLFHKPWKTIKRLQRKKFKHIIFESISGVYLKIGLLTCGGTVFRESSPEVLEKLIYNIFKYGISFIFIVAIIIFVEIGKDIYPKHDMFDPGMDNFLIDLDNYTADDELLYRTAFQKILGGDMFELQKKNKGIFKNDHLQKAIDYAEQIKKRHRTISNFFTKIIKKTKIKKYHDEFEGNTKLYSDIEKLQKTNFVMKGGKTKKKTRRFYGDWEIVSVHTRRTRKRR